MSKLWKFLSGPVTNVLDGVRGIIDELDTSDEEKLQAQLELSRIENAFQSKLLDSDQEFAKAQAEVLKAEIGSQSWLARNWRPILMLTFTYIVAHNYIIAPIFSLHSLPIPSDMWSLMKIGVGGYVIGRTVEKSAPTVAETLKK